MRFMNLFDRKKKRTVLIIQCRLSSTRLPRKALLPLGGKCVLEWVLLAMKKVKVDKYYLAVDTESGPELEPYAKKYGYEFFAGSKEDVLDRFCKVIELSKADVVIRATADNPFLFYEAAQALLDEYKDRSANGQIDYITWTGLPHGSGVELFDAHSLLKAAQATNLPYDHEHVGPALYNHKDAFNSVFVKAPKEFYYPELRTTIDIYGDYRRARAVVRCISGKNLVKEPYTVQQIVEALDNSAVKYPMLLIPSTVKGHGTGHLRRCLDIAVKTGADILIPSDASLAQCDDLVAMAKEKGLYDFQVVQSIENAELYNLAVLDNFNTPSAFLHELSSKCPVVALDEGALEQENCIDYILDVIPSISNDRYVNLTQPGFIEVGKNKKIVSDKTGILKTAVVVLGGEDPAGLAVPAATALAECGFSVTAVTDASVDVANVTTVSSIPNLKDKLYEYDLVVTHYGFTAFEAAAAGCAVILLGTTSLHEQLAKKYGFVCINADSVSKKSFEKVLEKPESLYPSVNEVFSDEKKLDLADFIDILSHGHALKCPVCCNEKDSEDDKQKNPVVARTAEHTFRRCRKCGMLYMSWTVDSEQTVYNHDYFYDDYKKQYGKTYEDDFAAIKAQCVRRISNIDRIYRHHHRHSSVTPTVFDIGCALGPFLDAANDSGWQVFGTDVSEDAINYVKTNLQYPAVCSTFPAIDVSAEFGVEQFDAVSMWFVIEHFQDVDSVLSAISKIVKVGGIFAFSTPSASGVSARYNTQSFFEQSPCDHYTLWEPARTASILKKYGFEVVQIVSTGIHPERFPSAKKKNLKEKSLEFGLLKFASRTFKLGDTFEVYCRKVNI